MIFDSLLGHETVKESLGRAIACDRISNAYVFEGSQGVGKKLCAKLFSQALVCENNNACGSCPLCVQALAGTLPDIITLTKDRDRASVGVDNVREQIISEVFLKPRNARRKIFIIEYGDELSVEAQNALLKVLEEPPSYVTFIICVTSKEKLLSTVLSRSQVVSFFPLGTNLVCDYLIRNYNISPERANVLAKLSQGSIGTAIELCQNPDKQTRIEKSIQSLVNLKKNSLKLREMVEFLTEEKENITEIIDYLMTFLRDCVMVKTHKDSLCVFADRISEIRVFTENISKKQLISAFDKLSNLKLSLKQNLNFNATVSEATMRIWEDLHDKGSGHQI